MKNSIHNQKFSIAVLLCFFSISQVMAATTPKWKVAIQGNKNSDYYKSIAAINNDTVYVVTNTAKVLRTTDAGTNWTSTNLPSWGSGFQPRSISFANAKVGYVAGDNSIAKTVDNGKTWTKLTDPGTGILITSVFAISADTCYFGAKGSVYYTYDGGKTINSTSVGGGLSSIFVTKQGTVYRCGSDGGIYKSTNKALSFKCLSNKIIGSFIDNQIPGIFFADENTGYAIGLKKTGEVPFANNIVKTTNAGNAWTGAAIGIGSSANTKGPMAVCIPTSGIGYVVGVIPSEGEIYIMKTTDAGVTFSKDSEGAVATDYYAVAVTPRGDVYVAGNGCVITRKAAK